MRRAPCEREGGGGEMIEVAKRRRQATLRLRQCGEPSGEARRFMTACRARAAQSGLRARIAPQLLQLRGKRGQKAFGFVIKSRRDRYQICVVCRGTGRGAAFDVYFFAGAGRRTAQFYRAQACVAGAWEELKKGK